MKKFLSLLLCGLFCLFETAGAGPYENLYPVIYETIKKEQYFSEKEDALALHGDTFPFDIASIREISKRSDFLQFNKIKIIKLVQMKEDAVVYFSVSGFTIPTDALMHAIVTKALENTPYDIATDLDGTPILWNNWNLMKAYIKKDEDTWILHHSDRLYKWQTNFLDEKLILQEDFSNIDPETCYEDGQMLYEKLLELVYRNPRHGNQDIFIVETEVE